MYYFKAIAIAVAFLFIKHICMPIESIDIEKFLLFSEKYPVIDVRSPGEFAKAHIPGAFSLPLFTDEQRKIIGTKYKQESREAAVKAGLELFSEKMKVMYNEAFHISDKWNEEHNIKVQNSQQHFILHCWRGGMRSNAVAWLMSLYGVKIYTIKGGYKSFRKWALGQFEKQYNLKILGGYTGSGKTILLEEIKRKQGNTINLEKFANHKGSAFGALGEQEQPSQEMFENLLAVELYKIDNFQAQLQGNSYAYTKTNTEIWIEDESRNIGKLSIPERLWTKMRTSKVYFIDIPFDNQA